MSHAILLLGRMLSRTGASPRRRAGGCLRHIHFRKALLASCNIIADIMLALGTIADLVYVYPAFGSIQVLLSILLSWKKS